MSYRACATSAFRIARGTTRWLINPRPGRGTGVRTPPRANSACNIKADKTKEKYYVLRPLERG